MLFLLLMTRSRGENFHYIFVFDEILTEVGAGYTPDSRRQILQVAGLLVSKGWMREAMAMRTPFASSRRLRL